MPRHLRRRRTPDVARTELLDAAERVFAKASPDQVGLKEVAKAAGTSHGLITHYFGTYDGLIAATLQRRTAALRERIFIALQTPGVLSRPDELVDMVFDSFDDPVHLRLVMYLVAGNRIGTAHAFALQERGIAQVAERVTDAVRPDATREIRDHIAVALMIAVAAAFGYSATRHSLAGGLGRAPSATLDRDVRHTLAQMVRNYIVQAELS
ncbi:MAG TPA: TetR/AcrR family transcriptional regulator [Kofleriaceae bacterium]|jgi:AcrR family transcriptional regulator